MQTQTAVQTVSSPLAQLLENYSAEVTSNDRKSIETAATMMRPGSEVFIASLPSDTGDRQVKAASVLRRAGLVPVPHVVARNMTNFYELEKYLERLRNEADVDRALILGGDRERPLGDLHSSLQILEAGLLPKHGIRKVALAVYPEAHLRISAGDIATARSAKLAAAIRSGLDVVFVSQFCFDSRPIVELAKQMSSQGITSPLRVGVAGPASRTSLIKYAMLCGVGASVRALKERQETARNLLAGETPELILAEVASSRAANSSLHIQGVHFFTFASLASTIQFVDHLRQGQIRI
ncbi:MAG TPA: hypothetical protein VGL34_15255 [Steroidobacteraceae bacterium]